MSIAVVIPSVWHYASLIPSKFGLNFHPCFCRRSARHSHVFSAPNSSFACRTSSLFLLLLQPRWPIGFWLLSLRFAHLPSLPVDVPLDVKNLWRHFSTMPLI